MQIHLMMENTHILPTYYSNQTGRVIFLIYSSKPETHNEILEVTQTYRTCENLNRNDTCKQNKREVTRVQYEDITRTKAKVVRSPYFVCLPFAPSTA